MERLNRKERKNTSESINKYAPYHVHFKLCVYTFFRKGVGYLSDNEAFVRNLEQLKVRNSIIIALGGRGGGGRC